MKTKIKNKPVNTVEDCQGEIIKLDGIGMDQIVEAVIVEAMNSSGGCMKRSQVLKRLTGSEITEPNSTIYFGVGIPTEDAVMFESARIKDLISGRASKLKGLVELSLAIKSHTKKEERSR